MTEKEQALFYKELCHRGISISETKQDIAGAAFVVKKILTAEDERVTLANNDKMDFFDSEEAAISSIKQYIKWQYKDEAVVAATDNKKEEPKETILHRFIAYMIVDFGFGPQSIDLGIITSECNSENSFQELETEAGVLAVNYISKYVSEKHVELRVDDVKYEARFRPENQR